MQFLRMSGSRYTVILGAKNIANIDLNAVLDYHRAGDSQSPRFIRRCR